MIRLKGKNISTANGGTKKVSLGATSNKKKDKEFSSTSSVPGVLTNTNLSNLPITIDLDPLLYGIAEDTLPTSVRAMSRLYTDMYFYDSIAGSTVDLYSCLPFSEFTLGGVSDPKIADIFYENIERLNIRTLPNEISVDYLVLGTFLASLLYNREKKIFFDVMPHNIGNAEVLSLPFYSQDPIITVTFPDTLRHVLAKDSPRIQKIKERLGPQLVEKLMSGSVELDPLGSLYVPRKTFSTLEGTSLYKRILPIYLLEKNLYRGTLVESMRRQRGILHITLGDGDQWDPTLEDMEQVTDLFLNADADPLGAVICTRMGVTTEEIRCVSGDTLISTENGLIMIDSLIDHYVDDQAFTCQVNIKVKGVNGRLVKADQWHYHGTKSVFSYYTESGAKITCTKNHKVAVLTEAGRLNIKKIGEVESTDYLCLELNGVEVKSKLPLDLKKPNVEFRESNKDFLLPKYMTPNLAWCIGLILSEGYISQNGVYVGNTNIDLLNHFSSLMSKLFQVNCHVRSTREEGYRKAHGQITWCKEFFSAGIHSKKLVCALEQMGLDQACNISEEGSPCTYYQIPWSVLQADVESKYAFLSAYVDGDGSVIVNKDSTIDSVSIRFFSTSVSILDSIKVLLADLGYHSVVDYCGIRVDVSNSVSAKLYNKLKPYIVSKNKKPFSYCEPLSTRRYGIPPEAFVPILKSRIIRKARHGTWFSNDEGTPVFIEGGWANVFRHYKSAGSYLLYEGLDANAYIQELDIIKKVSKSLYQNICRLHKLRFKFERLVKADYLGKKPVYDLSIEGNEAGKCPLYVQNGIVASNSGGDFWRWTEIIDQTSPYKMRALGVSESFLSGDQSYACVIGSTLIQTSVGLLPIEKIGQKDKGDLQPTNFECSSRYGSEQAVKWLNVGEAPTLTVSTDAGVHLTCTPIHKLLTLNTNTCCTEWTETRDLHIGDYVCVSTQSTLREKNFEFEAEGQRHVIDQDIAYLTGFLIKKSYLAKGVLHLSAPSAEVADKICQILSAKFEYNIRFLEPRLTAQIADDRVLSVFKKLGCLIDIKHSSLPINVLKTGREAQIAFLAAILDCSVNGKISISDPQAQRAVHEMLNAHGIMSNYTNAIYLMPGEAHRLCCKAKEHVQTSDYQYEPIRKWYGLPTTLKGSAPNFFVYDKHALGDYDEILRRIERTDPSIANNIRSLMSLRYRFVKVTYIRDAGTQQVYDLSMEREPSYVANGLVTHNTMENNMTVFVETLRSYRDMMTRKIFYNKLFPLISVIHGLRIKNGRIIRGESPQNAEEALEIMQDGSKLLIPIVHWNKQLKPEGDTGYLDILDRMTAAGVPVPLRTMAAAGGFNLDELLVQKDEDITVRKRFKEYMEEIAKINPPKGGGEGGGGEEEEFEGMASSSKIISEDPSGQHRSAVHAKGGNISLSERTFDPEIVGKTRTGKRKLIIDQKQANIAANNKIVKAMRNIAKSKNTPLTKTTITERK